ncbi:MAG: aquaporin [Gammaproteobacteria bacterium]
MNGGLGRRAFAEAIGSMLLVAAVVGSGIMAERLADGNLAIALLANSFATAGALVVLIAVLRPVSGAHLNPIVTLVLARENDLRWQDVIPYVAAQMLGAIAGTLLAHAMFELPLLQFAPKVRTGTGQILSELVATFGLVVLVLRCRAESSLGVLVAAYIAAAYWFTASTSFANPAVTVARMLTDSFAGIRPTDVPAFIAAQVAGAAAAVFIARILQPASCRP